MEGAVSFLSLVTAWRDKQYDDMGSVQYSVIIEQVALYVKIFHAGVDR